MKIDDRAFDRCPSSAVGGDSQEGGCVRTDVSRYP